MVHIIEGKPTTSQRFGRAFAEGGLSAAQGYSDYQSALKQEAQQTVEGEFLNKFVPKGESGQPFYDASQLSPDMRKVFLQQSLQRENRAQEIAMRMNPELEREAYNTMKGSFGNEFADVWKASDAGARTKLVEAAFQAASRGHKISDIFQNNKSLEGKEINERQPKESEYPSKNEFITKPSGYSDKEWIDERKTWRKENMPIFEDNKRKLQNNRADVLATKKLRQLNPHLPDDASRYLINPETGDFYGVAQVLGFKSPWAQEWSKVIARFQNRAKDAFGSRVTNFDLQSYMKQFPDLLNTQEGRQRILDMMDINFKLDNLHSHALQKIYDKYDLNGIPPESADKLARESIQDETEKLEQAYLDLDSQNQMEESKLSGKMIDVIGPDGQVYEIDEREVDQLPQGFRLQ